MSRRIIALNPQVLAELKQDKELYLIWFFVQGRGYDPDIDPLHNPDWREAMIRYEANMLADLKKQRDELTERFNSE